MTRRLNRRKGLSATGLDRHMAAMTEYDRSVLTLSQQKTKVRIGGETQEMTIADAVNRSTVQSALQGNSHAQWLIQHQTAEASAKREAEKALQRHNLEILYTYNSRAIRAAKAAGQPTELILPHPDDIDFSIETGPAIRGPADEADWLVCLSMARLRDALLLQDALDRALRGERSKIDFVPFDAASIALMIDLGLPSRLRLDVDTRFHRWRDYSTRPLRQLLKDVRAGWHSCGLDIARGTPSLAARFMEDLLCLLVESVRHLRRAKNDPGEVRAIEADLIHGLQRLGRAIRASARPSSSA